MVEALDKAAIQPEGGETLAQAAHRILKADIIRGVRQPGERLRIERLKSIYGIGPTPLREALQMLSADRIVVSEGNRGFAVAPLDVEEFEDLNTARTAIEKEALRLSIARGGDAWEARVVAAAYLMTKEDRALRRGLDRVPDTWEDANRRFHSAMVSACGSGWLLSVRGGLHDLCERYRRASVFRQLGERDLTDEHAEIAEAVLDRDAERACELTVSHYARTAESLAEALGLAENSAAAE